MSAADNSPGRQLRWLATVALAYVFALFTVCVAVSAAAQAWVEFQHGLSVSATSCWNPNLSAVVATGNSPS
jgi:hypothetical protein